MKIAIDSRPLTGGDSIRGVGVYTKQLAGYLKNNKDVEVSLVDAGKDDLSKFDLVHYQKFHPFFFSFPLKKVIPSVITIHDLIYLIYPKHYPPGMKGNLKFLIQKLLISKMDAIIAISETTKKDIVRFLGISQENIKVIYEAPREIFRPITNHESLTRVQKKYSLPDSFVLYVGDVNYNKNVSGLAEACKKAKIPLVIVGKQATQEKFDRRHPENKDWAVFLDKYGRDKNIKRLGFIEDNDLVCLYNLASLYCQPSFYEGFGLPVLEAFASGCPVVAAKTQALVEIGEAACLFADPYSTKDLSEKITQVVNNDQIRNELIHKGNLRVKDFSWEKTAKETLEVYRRVLGK